MKKNYRKWLISPIAILGVASLAAGCGAATSGSQQSNNTSASKTASGLKTSYPLKLKDDSGQTVTISKEPKRIASTTEGTDEILAALVPKKDVVMVTTYATQPAYSNIIKWAKGITAIQDANAEQIIAVHPDLVLAASYTKAGVVKQIQQTGIPIFEFNDFNSVQDIEDNVQRIGKLVDEQPKANSIVKKMKRELQETKTAVKGQKKVTVLDYSSFGFVAGSGTTVNNMILDAGGINAASKLNGWQKVTPEEVVKMNPQVIIDANTEENFVKTILKNPDLQTVSAVKHHRVYTVNGADLGSVSQYIVNGVQDIARVLYPSAKLPQ